MKLWLHIKRRGRTGGARMWLSLFLYCPFNLQERLPNCCPPSISLHDDRGSLRPRIHTFIFDIRKGQIVLFFQPFNGQDGPLESGRHSLIFDLLSKSLLNDLGVELQILQFINFRVFVSEGEGIFIEGVSELLVDVDFMILGELVEE